MVCLNADLLLGSVFRNLRRSLLGGLSALPLQLFGLPVCFFVSFNVEVAWNPTDGDVDVDVAEFLLGVCYFFVEDVKEVVARCRFDRLCGEYGYLVVDVH